MVVTTCRHVTTFFYLFLLKTSLVEFPRLNTLTRYTKITHVREDFTYYSVVVWLYDQNVTRLAHVIVMTNR